MRGKSYATFIIAFSLFTHSRTFPLQLASEADWQSSYLEDDMILSREQEELLFNNSDKPSMTARNAVSLKDYLWPDKVIFYRISKEFSVEQENAIHQAMLHIASRTCLRFQPVAGQRSASAYVYITGNDKVGCNSAVGYRGRLQYINLQRNSSCLQRGSIVHELLHTVGFYHEHSAADRDRYVRVRYENVQRGRQHNFAKYPPGLVSSYGVGYDYASVMHYGSKAFSRNGLDTIEPLAGAVRIGQREGLSKKDALKIRKMYAC